MTPAVALLFSAAVALADVRVDVDLAAPYHTVDKLYVNYNIDTGSLFNGMNFSDPKFRTLVAQLGPAIIRIGGTAVDASYYFPDTPYLVGQINTCDTCGNGASAIGEEMLTTIFDFLAATGMSLLWDLNGEMLRVGTGPWLPQGNFTPMADFLQSKYGGKVDYAYSVGNERASRARACVSMCPPIPSPGCVFMCPSPLPQPTCGRSTRCPTHSSRTTP
jgi:hypothetical protein